MARFADTVKFSLKPGLDPAATQRTLERVEGIGSVFALKARAGEPGAYDVEMTASADSACSVGHRIAQIEGIGSTTITPHEQHEILARIAAQEGREYRP